MIVVVVSVIMAMIVPVASMIMMRHLCQFSVSSVTFANWDHCLHEGASCVTKFMMCDLDALRQE